MENNADITEKSLNIEKKMPPNLGKHMVPKSIFKTNDEQIINEVIPTINIEIVERKDEIKDPDIKYISENKKIPKQSPLLKNLKRENTKKKSTFSKTLPGFSMSLFKILKFIKKRALYSSYKNLKDHHYQIIQDKATLIKEKPPKTKPKNFKSIWEIREYSNSRKLKSLDSSFGNFLKVMRRSQNFKEIYSKILKFTKKIPTIDPNHSIKVLWDTFIFVILLLKLFSYSLDRSFNQMETIIKVGTQSHQNLGLLYLLIIDLIFTLNTKIYLSGVCVSSRPQILWNYIKKYSFLDFLSLLQLFLNSLEQTSMRYLDFNLILLLKLFICSPDLSARFKNTLIKNNNNFEGICSLLSLGAKILVSGHIIACLWYFTSYRYSQNHPEGNYWIKEKGLLDEEWYIKYLYSIYWGVTTMLTVGYGDIVPKNEDEILLTICSMLIGCVIFGYSLNRIGEIIKRSSKHHRILKKNREHILKMSTRMNLSKELQTKLVKYLEFVKDQEMKIDPEIEKNLLSKLSHSLRDEVHKETRVKYLRNVPLLIKILSEKSLLDLARNMVEKRFMPEEPIFGINHREDSLYIIIEGEVSINAHNNEEESYSEFKLETYGKNEFFGIEEFITGFPTRSQAVANQFTTLLQIKREEFLEVVKKDAIEYERFCYARENLIVYNNPIQLEVKCSSCGRMDHKVVECPFLSYRPNKLIIVGRYIQKKKKRNGLGRKLGRMKLNALRNLGNNTERLYDLRNNLEGDEEYLELVESYQPPPEKEVSSEINIKNENKEALITTEMINSVNRTNTNGDEQNFLFKTSKTLKRVESTGTNQYVNSPSHNKCSAYNDKKSITYDKSTTFTRSRREISEILFLPLDRVKNFRYFFPKCNSETIIKKIKSRNYMVLTNKTVK